MFLTAYKEFWKRYVDFTGKSTLSEYWFAYLWNTIISVIFFILMFFGLLIGISQASSSSMSPFGFFDPADVIFSPFLLIPVVLFCLFVLASLVPRIAIIVRRLRDGGFHWSFVFLSLIPAIGEILLNLILVTDGNRIALGLISLISLACSAALIVLLAMPSKSTKSTRTAKAKK